MQNFKLLACFCDCTDRFVSDIVGNTEDRFSQLWLKQCRKSSSAERSQGPHGRNNWCMKEKLLHGSLKFCVQVVAISAQLICAFVFTYAKVWFSHEMAHI